MPSRRPPSQRDPAYALHRLAGAVQQVLPGAKVKNASPVRPPSTGRLSTPTTTLGLWVGTDAPTDGSVFWYDTDAT